jgi:hypothetical protein
MQMEEAVTTMAAMQEPDALPCPMCEYDLRGQIEPRCPECGYRFNWDELRDPARRLHPYLFEHHPESNVRSFLRTLLGGLLPGRFWRALLPVQPSRPRRLWAYFGAVSVLMLLPNVVALTQATARQAARVRAVRAGALATLNGPQGPRIMQMPRYAGMTAQQIIDREMPPPTLPRLMVMTVDDNEEIAAAAIITAAAILWPLATVAAMMVFRISMRRARVRPIHVLRCALYSADIFLWAALAFAAAFLAFMLLQPGRVMSLDEGAVGSGIAAAYLVFAWRLVRAFKLYLRFDHAIATVVATQIIVWLMLANVAQAIVFAID